MSNNKPAIEFRNIEKTYKDRIILQDFNLKISEGEFVSIIGPSGSGKTTILKMVNGLVQPTQGNILINGVDIRNKDLISLRRHIGYVMQGNVLFPHMTVEKNISYVLDIAGGYTEKQKTDEVKKCMHLAQLSYEFKNFYPDELSGGQKQRVNLARAIAGSPKILLMDEPFASLDKITRSQLQRETKNIYKQMGITILFITHDITEACILGTHIAVINNHCLQQYATPDELVKNPNNDFVKHLFEDEDVGTYKA